VEELSDDDLIRMYCHGDADAFDALFDRHCASVYNFARTMLNGSHDAEEVLQEAFLVVARTANSYVPRGLFRVWLMRITRNLCLNRLERERARRRAIAQSGLAVAELASPDPSGAESAEADERMAALRRLIRELPERQREAITLYAFEHMSYREIAQALEVPLNTVKTLIHRARAALAEGFEPFLRE
jgi:RNA polymerase sigma-70 factor (ECF subfamily)